ncbi:hypothetical protein ILUMI_13113 [Ignelater luminosus]|uniref:Uncharacterized protein n=1 Tax=Ignelater luminosus TaxID=2038154 RepID=A0A8K0G8Y7_IGNLU|nr:hypothetical protein ILUMI_13113 [Ignelater luminosus]
MVDLIMEALVPNLARTKSRIESETGFMTYKNKNEHVNLTSEDEIRFVIDTGAKNHLVTKEVGNFIINETPVNRDISMTKSGHQGPEARGPQIACSTGNPIKMRDVWVCHGLSYNLLSAKKLQQAGLKVIFRKDLVLIKKGVLTGQLE